MDSSDDDDSIIETILLQKQLISESQSLHGSEGVNLPDQTSTSESREQGNVSTDGANSSNAANEKVNLYSKALAANIEYDNKLSRVESNLKDLIADCKNRLAELSQIRETGKPLAKVAGSIGCRNGLYIFGAPYFKDDDYFSCLPNPDVKKKANNGEKVWTTPTIRWWTPEHTKKLVAAVKETVRAECKQNAINYKHGLLRRLKALEATSEDAMALKAEIQSFSINRYVQNTLNHRIANSDHDWLKISASMLEGKHSPAECRGFWYNYLHPKFHKGVWEDWEKEKLRDLAEKYCCQDWETIAKKLGTKRSGYQCFAQYYNAVNLSSKQKWSQEEDNRLKALIAKHQVGDYIPWSQVTQQMVGRSQTQVYNRWTYTLDPNIKKGKFSTQEDIIILCAVRKWGEDFQKIAQYMPNRTVPQIRARFHNCHASMSINTPFSDEDDALILDLVSQHGSGWTKIAEHFPGRSKMKIRQRYNTLKTWAARNPTEPPEKRARRSRRPQIDTTYHNYWSYAEKLLSKGTQKTNDCPPTTSILAVKAVVKPKARKKQSEADEKLREYFLGSYMPKPAHGSTRTFGKEDEKCVKQMALFLELLGAKLIIPSDAVLEADNDFDDEDRDMLKALRAFTVADDSSRLDASVVEPTPVPSYSCIDIDCPPQTASSVSITLPFTTDYPPDVTTITIKEEMEPELPGSYPQLFFGNLRYLCPPNHATMVGLRSILIRKKSLVDTLTKYDEDPLQIDRHYSESKVFREATRLWDDRLLFLFALPNVLSKIKPTDHTENAVLGNSASVASPFESDGEDVPQSGETSSEAASKKRKSNKNKIIVRIPTAPRCCEAQVVPSTSKDNVEVATAPSSEAVTPSTVELTSTLNGVTKTYAISLDVEAPSTAKKQEPKKRTRKPKGTTPTRVLQSRGAKTKSLSDDI